LCLAPAGCAHIENQFREDGPSVDAQWDSPTAADVYARFQPAEARMRAWDVTATQSEDGTVTHAPLYFEDPYEDKGSAALRDSRDVELDEAPEYRMGWEDVVAAPYGYARHTLNWLALPVSMVVTPPWTEMESDGVLSEQALGYDHDARRASDRSEPRVPPAAGDSAQPQPANAPPRMEGLQVIRP
jgi:hypothetical protein